MNNNKVKYINFSILLLNIFAVLSLTVFIYITTQKICDYFSARDFLRSVTAVPRNPMRLVITSIVLIFLLAISFFIREIIFVENTKIVYSTLFLDFVISLLLVYVLNFNYNGILLLVFANVVTHVKGNVERYVLMFLAITVFLTASYELMSITMPLYSVMDYIEFYNMQTMQYLIVAYNLLTSINIVVFIIYCIIVIQFQKNTIDEVNQLYTELFKVNEELEGANNRLQEYAVITEKMGETKERNRLAREIHDTLGHTLTGISVGIDACITTIDFDTQQTKKRLEVLSEVARQGIQEVRRSVNELRPDSLERLSLEQAIMQMIHDVKKTTDTKVFFHSDLEKLKFDEDEENALYRIVQESITNAIRHGNATKIWISIKKQDANIILKVQDNGIGAKKISSGFGLRHIYERVELLCGKVSFDGADGFTVIAEIPIRWGKEYD